MTLLDIEKKGAYSNLSLNENIRKMKPGEPAFVRELVYGTLKNKYLLDHYLKSFIKRGFGSLKPEILTILRMGAYQILFMDSVPSYAAVSESVNLSKKFARGRESFVNGVLRSLDRGRDSLKYPEKDDFTRYLSIRYSLDPGLASRFIGIFGEEGAEEYLRESNKTPELAIRVNLLKTGPEELMKELEGLGFEVRRSQVSPRSLIVSGTGVLETDAFRSGRFSVQDEASTLAADILDPEPGMKVMDLCAAPGGKTAAIAELMENRGEVLAFDIYEHKLSLIEGICRRNGIQNVKALQGDGRVFMEEHEGTSDRVLTDVPCSGLGVIRRKPEIKYRDPGDTEELVNTQKCILENGARYLKAGRALVYSTCTVDPRENRMVTEAFLMSHPGYMMEREECLSPINGTDGFYICKILRRNI